MPVLNKEPKYIAYRIDLERSEEFYNLDEACDFFDASKSSISNRSGNTKISHLIGSKIGERWLIFNARLKNKYVQEVLETWKSIDTKFHY